MSEALKADDLLPLIAKLPHDEQVRLAKMALRAATATGDDAAAYRSAPPADAEFAAGEDGLAWDADGWEGFRAEG